MTASLLAMGAAMLVSDIEAQQAGRKTGIVLGGSSATPEEERVKMPTEPEALAKLKSIHRKEAPSRPDKPINGVCFVEGKKSAGTGFFYYENGNYYVVTNQHVLAASANPQISNIEGDAFVPLAVEVATDRDLARMLVADLPCAFVNAPEVDLGDSITVYGNSQGSKRITSISGEVNGLNDIEVEVDAGFVTGNSGSPIVNDDNDLVGVATYVQLLDRSDLATEGTRFTKARRVGVRITQDVEWLPIQLAAFSREATRFARFNAFADEALMLFAEMSSSENLPIEPKTLQNPDLRRWYEGLSELLARGKQRIEARETYEGRIEVFNQMMTEFSRLQGGFSSMVHSTRGTVLQMRLYPNTTYWEEQTVQLKAKLDYVQEASDAILDGIAQSLNQP